ncbi:putative NADPH2 dehydrogenase chain OYE2 [Mycena rosella]|uniref:NADPH2 dehydrogenase chain OYE2 n=1 Tax=Mycena rosella TaxID=1033263 RepID=A0AAD7C9N7_MYCRO|nr:putative NADPH2 dehydrogenase chain OYE2 [Mycena rosella]
MAPQLFEPLGIGTVALQHRVVLAPLTRFKASAEHVPYLPIVAEYYAQRASPGTLLIPESTLIAARAGGFANVPGIWGLSQIAAWREVAAAVHAKGSFIFMQLWALGRVAEPTQLAAVTRGRTFPYVSASDVPLAGRSLRPRALSVAEIEGYVAIYAQAARNAIAAGCDGVEVHAANGYLPDQFLQDVSNTRTDAYGGSIVNRARFVLEVVDAVVAAVGPERTAIRFSPWSTVHDMGMQDPLPTFSYLVSELAARHPTLAYLHLIEPRISGDEPRAEGTVGAHESNDALRALWAPRPLIRAGGFDRARCNLVAFGRLFISNPDLPTRLEQGAPLAPYDRRTFYLSGVERVATPTRVCRHRRRS